jgi:hypothetical protein
MPKPKPVAVETGVVTPIADAPRRQRLRRTRRWPVIVTLTFAVCASVILWTGIVTAVRVAVAELF